MAICFLKYFLVLQRLHQRTKMTHGDVALNTLRVVGEGEKAECYVLDIPEYPWILRGEARQQSE